VSPDLPAALTAAPFPTLRMAHFQCFSPAQYELTQPMISESVTSLEATLDWDCMTTEQAHNALLPIVRRCPNLQHVDIRCWMIRTVQPFAALRLESLGVTYSFLGEAEIELLASLKTVRHLSLLIETDDPSISVKTAELLHFSDQLGTGSFDHLQSLMIRTGESLYPCISMIKRLREHRLRNLHIDAECVSDRMLNAAVDAVAEHCRGLTALYWHARTQNSDMRLGGSRNWATVAILGQCRHITSFQFTSSSKDEQTAFVWDDMDLDAISGVWPRLEKLRLISLINSFDYEAEKFRPQITWKGLATLAKSCPGLKLAQLEFDASERGWTMDDIVPAPNLEMLCLAWTRVDSGTSYETVARRILQLWPNANVGWGLWYGGQVERPGDRSEDIVNRFPDLNDKSYEQALTVALNISHNMHCVRQQEEAMENALQLLPLDHSSYHGTVIPRTEEEIVSDTRVAAPASMSINTREAVVPRTEHLDRCRDRPQAREANGPQTLSGRWWKCTVIRAVVVINDWVVEPMRRTLRLSEN